MVESAVMEPGSRIAHHHDGNGSSNGTESPSKAAKALVSIWNFTLKKLMEFTQDDVIEDKSGCKRVLKIATDIGNMVLGDVETQDTQEPFAIIAPVEHLADVARAVSGNGNGHRSRGTKKQMRKSASKSVSDIKFPSTLSPQERKFCEFLRQHKGKGYITSKTICKALGINHLGSLVTKVRQKGVPVSSAHTDRQDGKKIPETAQGFMLN